MTMTILEKQWSLCNKTYVTKKISCKLFISPQLFKEWGYILQNSVPNVSHLPA